MWVLLIRCKIKIEPLMHAQLLWVFRLIIMSRHEKSDFFQQFSGAESISQNHKAQ